MEWVPQRENQARSQGHRPSAPKRRISRRGRNGRDESGWLIIETLGTFGNR